MTDPYTMDADFERAVIRYMVTDRRFYGAIRQGLEPEAFPSADARMVAEVCGLCFQETGNGPGSEVIVNQRLRHMCHEDGKITIDTAIATMLYVQDAVDDDACPDAESVLSIFVPQLKDRVKTEVLRDALMGEGIEEIRKKFDQVDQIGFVDTSLGSRLGSHVFKGLGRIHAMEKLPTGMVPLDAYLRGGIPRGSTYCIGGDSNAGKSTALTQMAAANIREGGLVLFATNEDPEHMVQAKILADLTDVPFEQLLQGNTDVAERRYVERGAKYGTLFTKEIEVDLFSPTDLEEWKREVEESEGRKVDVIVIDYADRMTDGKPDRGDYHLMKNVYNGLQTIAKKGHCVVATASQTKELKRGSKWIRLGDLSDSKHKGRIAKVVVTLNPKDDEYWVYVAKSKLVKADHEIKIVATDWAFGRITPVPPRVVGGASYSDEYAAYEVEQGIKANFDARKGMVTQ